MKPAVMVRVRRDVAWTIVAVVMFTIALFSCPATVAAAGAVDEMVDALKGGKPTVSLRYRLENVTDDALAVQDKNALASTLRTALGYRTGAYRDVSAFIEFQNVTPVGRDLYNNAGAGALSNRVTDRPVVADPRITSVHQAYLDVAGIPDTRVRVGRDALTFDDLRFIGTVGWRQHHQSFDAVSVKNTSIADLTVTYAYVWDVRRIFGDNTRMNSHLVNAQTKMLPQVNVTGFYYHLEYDRTSFEGLSTGTLGGRVHGTIEIDDWLVPFEASFAKQRDVGDNPGKVDALYYRANIGATSPTRVGASAGFEVLGGKPGDGRITTPLATLHKFNGFADKFLSTPPDGLYDAFVEVNAMPGNFNLRAIYHWFAADEGTAEYGTEFDLVATYKSPWGAVYGAKGAFYQADTHAFDTNKVMVWAAHTLH